MGPKLYLFAEKQYFLVFAADFGEKRVAVAKFHHLGQDGVAVDEVDAVLAPTDIPSLDAKVSTGVEHFVAYTSRKDKS